MIKNRITIEKQENGNFVVCVDGGNIGCATTAEVMSRVGAEMGMPFNKAQRQLFERMENAERLADELEQKITDYAEITAGLQADNAILKSAIVKCFVKTFGKEG